MNSIDLSLVTTGNNFQSRVETLGESVKDSFSRISSGLISDSFSGLASQGILENTLSLEFEKTKYDDYVRGNTLAMSKIDFAKNQMDNILNINAEFLSAVAIRRSPSGEFMQFGQLCKNILADIQNALNAQNAGAYIFAGTEIFQKPVGDIVNSSILIDGVGTNSFYLGSAETMNVQASDTLNIEYGVKADYQGFVDLIAAVQLAIQADQENNNDKFETVVDLASQSHSELVQVRTKLGISYGSIEAATAIHQNLSSLTGDLISQNLSTDIAQESTLLMQNITTLQASYMAMSKMMNLSLEKYL